MKKERITFKSIMAIIVTGNSSIKNVPILYINGEQMTTEMFMKSLLGKQLYIQTMSISKKGNKKDVINPPSEGEILLSRKNSDEIRKSILFSGSDKGFKTKFQNNYEKLMKDDLMIKELYENCDKFLQLLNSVQKRRIKLYFKEILRYYSEDIELNGEWINNVNESFCLTILTVSTIIPNEVVDEVFKLTFFSKVENYYNKFLVNSIKPVEEIKNYFLFMYSYFEGFYESNDFLPEIFIDPHFVENSLEGPKPISTITNFNWKKVAIAEGDGLGKTLSLKMIFMLLAIKNGMHLDLSKEKYDEINNCFFNLDTKTFPFYIDCDKLYSYEIESKIYNNSIDLLDLITTCYSELDSKIITNLFNYFSKGIGVIILVDNVNLFGASILRLIDIYLNIHKELNVSIVVTSNFFHAEANLYLAHYYCIESEIKNNSAVENDPILSEIAKIPKYHTIIKDLYNKKICRIQIFNLILKEYVFKNIKERYSINFDDLCNLFAKIFMKEEIKRVSIQDNLRHIYIELCEEYNKIPEKQLLDCFDSFQSTKVFLSISNLLTINYVNDNYYSLVNLIFPSYIVAKYLFSLKSKYKDMSYEDIYTIFIKDVKNTEIIGYVSILYMDMVLDKNIDFNLEVILERMFLIASFYYELPDELLYEFLLRITKMSKLKNSNLNGYCFLLIKRMYCKKLSEKFNLFSINMVDYEKYYTFINEIDFEEVIRKGNKKINKAIIIDIDDIYSTIMFEYDFWYDEPYFEKSIDKEIKFLVSFIECFFDNVILIDNYQGKNNCLNNIKKILTLTPYLTLNSFSEAIDIVNNICNEKKEFYIISNSEKNLIYDKLQTYCKLLKSEKNN